MTQIRQRWPGVQILVRADSGFCREELLHWCEQHAVDYIIGVARNKRLRRRLGKQMYAARQQYKVTGKPARVFTQFPYRTRKSWTRARRVIAKAEYLPDKENPRFVMTSLREGNPQTLYEKLYCARGIEIRDPSAESDFPGLSCCLILAQDHLTPARPQRRATSPRHFFRATESFTALDR